MLVQAGPLTIHEDDGNSGSWLQDLPQPVGSCSHLSIADAGLPSLFHRLFPSGLRASWMWLLGSFLYVLEPESQVCMVCFTDASLFKMSAQLP